MDIIHKCCGNCNNWNFKTGECFQVDDDSDNKAKYIISFIAGLDTEADFYCCLWDELGDEW